MLENGNTYSYFYKRDAKGEIVDILDFWGTKVASYYYDAYGQVISIKDHGGNEVKDASTHLGNLNPFKFKGYYSDYEAKWYYLQSRYYDPEVQRFLNADAIIQPYTTCTGTNMFAYCGNNPVMARDGTGYDLEFGMLNEVYEDNCGTIINRWIGAGLNYEGESKIGSADFGLVTGCETVVSQSLDTTATLLHPYTAVHVGGANNKIKGTVVAGVTTENLPITFDAYASKSVEIVNLILLKYKVASEIGVSLTIPSQGYNQGMAIKIYPTSNLIDSEIRIIGIQNNMANKDIVATTYQGIYFTPKGAAYAMAAVMTKGAWGPVSKSAFIIRFFQNQPNFA